MPQRRVVIYNYSKRPPQVVGTVTLNQSGTVSLDGFVGAILAQLTHGIPKPPKMDRYVTVADGAEFVDAVLMEYKGAYIRAVEESV